MYLIRLLRYFLTEIKLGWSAARARAAKDELRTYSEKHPEALTELEKVLYLD